MATPAITPTAPAPAQAPQPAGFDVDAARKAGYSDDEILGHLTESRKFDVQGAVKSGYSKQEIISHLAGPSVPSKASTPAAAAPGFVDKMKSNLQQMADQPLTSYGAATESGLANVGLGVTQAVEGAYNTIRHPVETAKGIASMPSQAAQVPGAIHDINQSPDPVGTYAHVAGETAGQGAGQALAAVAAEGVTKGARFAKSTVGKAVDVVTAPGRRVEAAEQALSHAKTTVTNATADAAKASAEAHPTVLSQKVNQTLQGVASKEGFTPLKGATPREALPELAGKFRDRAKTAYRSVDTAVGGELQPVLDGIEETKQGIKAQQAIDPQKAASLKKQLSALETKKTSLIETARENGVSYPDQVIRAADKDWARFRTMETMAKQIKTASGEVRTGGLLDSKKFASAIDRLNDTGKLQRALEDPDVQALKGHGVDALNKLETAKAAGNALKESQRGLTKAEAAAQAAKDAQKQFRWKLVKTGAGAVGLTQVARKMSDVLSGGTK